MTLEREAPASVEVVCSDLGQGGAARATLRLVQALRSQEPRRDVRVRTVRGRPAIEGQLSGLPGGSARPRRQLSRLRSRVAGRLPFVTANPILHSRADVWTGLQRELDRSPADVLNLHWLGTGTMSIEEVGRLRRPVVMTLHDMWAFSGAEHYTFDDRYRHGYPRGSRTSGESGFDLNRHTWKRKKASWSTRQVVVTPSQWLADCVAASELMGSWPVVVVPNPIDTDFWRPLDRGAARVALDLPPAGRIVLFGAVGGERSHIKGADLLWSALAHLRSSSDGGGLEKVIVGVFGGKRTFFEPPGRIPFPTHHLGPISDDRLLRLVYSAADVMVIPSRLDNLPNTGVEAQACGLPVVAFRVGGLADVVGHGESGFLVDEEDARGMAEAIGRLLSSETTRLGFAAGARRRAEERFHPARVSGAYGDIFDGIRASRGRSTSRGSGVA